MAIPSKQDEARFETTKRLLATLINEGLVDTTVEKQSLRLCPSNADSSLANRWVTVETHFIPANIAHSGVVISIVRPEMLKTPVTLSDGESEWTNVDPEAIFTFVAPWFEDGLDQVSITRVAKELRSSADFQEKWIERSTIGDILPLKSPSIDWEQSVVFGHPTHPLHRACFTLSPLEPIFPTDIPELLKPSLSFVSVPREDLRITGPFEETIKPLLRKLDLPPAADGQVIVPCFTRQLPSIFSRFPNATVIKTVEDCFDAQTSLRTLTPRPELGFPYHVKLPLAVQITSAIRTITPWTTYGSPMVTKILDELTPSLPSSLWFFRELAAVAGSQSDYDDAKHLACILREDIEGKAKDHNEVLVIATALFEKRFQGKRTYPEIRFNLETDEQKLAWFRRYVKCLFETVLPLAYENGIAVEAHQQNTVVRFCASTGEIKGFAVRDYGGIRMHKPTLRAKGFDTNWEVKGGIMLADDMEYVWDNLSHALIQNHVAHLLYALDLEALGGWAVVRQELAAVLKPYESGSAGAQLWEFLTRETMNLKCFLKMRFEGIYRSNIERELPNILLS